MKKQMKSQVSISKTQKFSLVLTPICIKPNTRTQNKFASDDSIELGLRSTMNNEDNSSILNSKTDEKESSDNIMYLIPKEPK